MNPGPYGWLMGKWEGEESEQMFAADLAVLGVTREKFEQTAAEQGDDGDDFYDQRLLDALTSMGKRLRVQRALSLGEREEPIIDRVLDQMIKENRAMVNETRRFMRI